MNQIYLYSINAQGVMIALLIYGLFVATPARRIIAALKIIAVKLGTDH